MAQLSIPLPLHDTLLYFSVLCACVSPSASSTNQLLLVFLLCALKHSNVMNILTNAGHSHGRRQFAVCCCFVMRSFSFQ